MDITLLEALLEKQLRSPLSKEERDELDDLIVLYPEEAKQLIEAKVGGFNGELAVSTEVREEMLQMIFATGQTAAPVRRIQWMRWVAAAVILAAIATSYLLLRPEKEKAVLSQAERFKNDVQPGRTGAVLVLSDGRTVLLDTARNGSLLEGFEKSAESVTVSAPSVQYATVTTPKGRVQPVQLIDGTLVYLNAGSSIRFPTAFGGNTREVAITGEAYFEVAKDKTKPFIVHTATDQIEVLGTHFNINAYETIKTTLLEGSVKIGQSVLKPGEQFVNGQVTEPDIEEVMAWKNGMFRFNGTNIKEIMAQVERWYDVEVVYEGDVTKLDFTAGVARTSNVSELLKKLELTKTVQFTIEGQKITVRP